MLEYLNALSNTHGLSLVQSTAYSLYWLVVGGIGLVAMLKLIDWIGFRHICFNEELKKGNVAVGILVGAIFLGLSIIAAVAIS